MKITEQFFEEILNLSRLTELNADEIATPYYVAMKKDNQWIALPPENPMCYTSVEDADNEINRLKNDTNYKNKEIRKFKSDAPEIKDQVNDPKKQGCRIRTHNADFFKSEEVKNRVQHKILHRNSPGYNTEK